MPGSSNTGNPVVDAILNGTSNAEVREAMLLGSYLESTWSQTAVGDGGTSFGPFQMHIGGALTAAGGTPSDAENPAWAVQHMMSSYVNGVNSVAASLWASDPEQAAEEAAVAAEKPLTSYYASQGQAKVDEAWNATQGALKGKVSTSGSPSSGSGTTTTGFDVSSIIGDIESALTGGLVGGSSKGLGGVFGALASWFTGQFGINNVKDFAIRFGLILMGGILVIIGISSLTRTAVTDVMGNDGNSGRSESGSPPARKSSASPGSAPHSETHSSGVSGANSGGSKGRAASPGTGTGNTGRQVEKSAKTLAKDAEVLAA